MVDNKHGKYFITSLLNCKYFFNDNINSYIGHFFEHCTVLVQYTECSWMLRLFPDHIKII